MRPGAGGVNHGQTPHYFTGPGEAVIQFTKGPVTILMRLFSWLLGWLASQHILTKSTEFHEGHGETLDSALQ